MDGKNKDLYYPIRMTSNWSILVTESESLAQDLIPTYALYGEFLSGTYADPIHHEKIFERSQQHGWDIKLHRHEGLAQLFLFQTSDVRVQIDDMDFQTQTPTALFIPPMTTHGFRFPKDTVGDVISLPIDQLSQGSRVRLDRSRAIIATAQTNIHFEAISQLVAQIAQTFHAFQNDRPTLFSHLTELLFIYLGVGMTDVPLANLPAVRTDTSRHERQARDFCKLIETYFATDLPVGGYAKHLGVSAPHLTRVARRILGDTPSALITRRRMVEAERLLRFTRQSIAEIATRAGYHDVGYFSRAFKKNAGMSPKVFRRLRAT